MKEQEFINEIKKLNIDITREQLEQLKIYADYLIEYNQHTNLTAITNKDDIYLKHFYDSITIIKSIDLNKVNNLVDVGSGAGFPGIVLKIFYPHLKVTLIDSNNKKITFLEEVIKKLDLKEIKTYYGRAEEYAINNIDTYDLVTARAVSDLGILTELCLPLVKVNGSFISLKGNCTEELSRSKEIIKLLNGKVEKILEFSLPKEESMRSIIEIKKIASNPQGYPRTYDKIKKSLKKNRK